MPLTLVSAGLPYQILGTASTTGQWPGLRCAQAPPDAGRDSVISPYASQAKAVRKRYIHHLMRHNKAHIDRT
jgi:hypothetical protein